MSEKVVYDCCLLQFYESMFLKNRPLMLLPNEQVSIKKYFADHPHLDIEVISLENMNKDQQTRFIPQPIKDILSLSDGKVSICGIKPSRNHSGYLDGYNLYFEGLTEVEARGFVKMYSETFDYPQSFSHINCCDEIVLKVEHYYVTFHVIPCDDKSHMLGKVRTNQYKFGWNPIYGYFCSVVAALELSLNFRKDTLLVMYSYQEQKRGCNIKQSFYEKYHTLTIFKETFSLHSDIFRFIYSYWIKTELYYARKRLVTR